REQERVRRRASVLDMDRSDEDSRRTYRAADLRKERPMEEVEVADQIEAIRFEHEAIAFQIADPGVDPIGDVPAPRFFHHPLDPDARAVEGADPETLLGEEKGVTARPAGEVEGQAGRDAANRVGKRRRRSERVHLVAPGESLVPLLRARVHAK